VALRRSVLVFGRSNEEFSDGVVFYEKEREASLSGREGWVLGLRLGW